MKNITVGLIIPHYPQMFSTFYTMEVVQGVSKGALSLNVDLLIHIAHKVRGEEEKAELKFFDPHFVNGLLFADIMGNEKLVKEVRAKEIPYIILNYFDKESKDNCIGIDNESASLEVINYLVGLGHRRIATITGKLQAQAGRDRLLGYKKGLKNNRLELNDDYILEGDWTKEAGRKALERILKLDPRPTAVFVAGDEMAFGLIEEAKQRGIDIPGDLSVVGFDDIPLASSNLISLTTVKQPLYEVGRLGIRHLKDIIEKKEKGPLKILLNNTQIITRKSVKSLI
jgi:LacI family transcriptional regulator